MNIFRTDEGKEEALCGVLLNPVLHLGALTAATVTFNTKHLPRHVIPAAAGVCLHKKTYLGGGGQPLHQFSPIFNCTQPLSPALIGAKAALRFDHTQSEEKESAEKISALGAMISLTVYSVQPHTCLLVAALNERLASRASVEGHASEAENTWQLSETIEWIFTRLNRVTSVTAEHIGP